MQQFFLLERSDIVRVIQGPDQDGVVVAGGRNLFLIGFGDKVHVQDNIFQAFKLVDKAWIRVILFGLVTHFNQILTSKICLHMSLRAFKNTWKMIKSAANLKFCLREFRQNDK